MSSTFRTEQPGLKRWITLACTSLLILCGASRAFAQCPTITNHGWPQNTIVRYWFDTGSGFTEEQKRQIRAAAAEWNRANSINNSKVSFVEDTTGANFILRFEVGALAQGNPAVFSGTIDGATGTVKTGRITYDPNNTFPGSNILIADPAVAGYSTAVMKLILHEMGHLMGLDHPAIPADVCDQPDGATVMNYACGINDQGNNIPTTIPACDQNAINSESIYPSINLPAPVVTIDSSTVASPISEGAGRVTINVNRTGNHTLVVTVDLVTNDAAGLTPCNTFNGVASPRCDYALTFITLRFEPGELQKTVSIPIVDDGYVEGNETFSVSILHPVNATTGNPNTVNATIQDNDTGPSNPIDQNPFFVRQHYIDFLGREPEPAGLQAWLGILNGCPPGSTACDRVEVSSAFFRSPEFQDRGFFIYRFYSAVGKVPLYSDFMPDLARVSGFQSAAQLEESKVAFVNEFMTRDYFKTKYDSLTTPTAYVDGLLQTLGLPNHPGRQGWINGLTNGSLTRAQVLRQVTESGEVSAKYFNEAFVIMQYFGYLRRSADASWTTWVQTMNSNGGDYRIMVNGFVNSAEYRQRFGP